MKIIKTDKFFGQKDQELSFEDYVDICISSTIWDEEENSVRNFVKLKQSFINLSQLLIEKGVFDIQEFHEKVIRETPGLYFNFEE